MPQEISPSSSRGDFREELQFLGRCPVCSTKYDPLEAQILNNRENLTMAHVDCVKCASSVIVAIMSTKMGLVTTIGMITDLTKEDLARSATASAITIDDVICLHERLEKIEKKNR